MKTITYSFIIPHKNCPDLLQRCVNSIPRRDDVQIIVVDDDSDPEIVDWNSFRFQDERCIELVLTKGGHSAGAARNEGLKKAVGKWILFADSDDYYVDGFMEVLDSVSDVDVLFFNYQCIDDKSKKKLFSKKDQIFEEYEQDDSKLEKIRFFNSPVIKMVAKVFLDKYHINFEDVILGNDIWYSYQIGFFAKDCKVTSKKLYVYAINNKSITTFRSVAKDVVQIETYVKQNAFFDYIGHPEWHISLPGMIKFHWLRSNQKVKYAFALLVNALRIYKVRNKYVDGIKDRLSNDKG